MDKLALGAASSALTRPQLHSLNLFVGTVADATSVVIVSYSELKGRKRLKINLSEWSQ